MDRFSTQHGESANKTKRLHLRVAQCIALVCDYDALLSLFTAKNFCPMIIDPDTGLLRDATHVLSPNCDARPDGVQADLIVLHSISLPPGEYGGAWINQFFQNELDATAHEYFDTIKDLRVSAHVLVRRNGEVVQYVPFHLRAWHAGQSSFQGRSACNDFSIGIEMEGTDETSFSTAQYWQVAKLITLLQNTYASLADCPVVGHSDIAPGRKTDPGSGFHWDRLQRVLRAISTISV